MKELRYRVMLALYLPILLYAFSTFELEEDVVAAKKVKPVLVGGQTTVVMGQEYTASAYLTATQLAKGGEVTLTAEGESITIENNQTLRIPTGRLLAEGEDKKEVSYEVQMGYGQLGDSSLTETLRGSFTVRRPELVARSVATRSLYRRTANEIRISVPGLEHRDLRLESSTGKSADGRHLRLSPAGDSVSVRAYLPDGAGEEVYLGTKQFVVTDPPRPQIKIRNATGEELTSGDNLSRRRPVVEVEVEPDREFAQRHPQDATYRVRAARVSIRRGLQASEVLGTFSVEDGGRLQLTKKLQNAASGDRILIQLQGVVRINHAGQAVPVDLSESFRSFSFVLS